MRFDKISFIVHIVIEFFFFKLLFFLGEIIIVFVFIFCFEQINHSHSIEFF